MSRVFGVFKKQSRCHLLVLPVALVTVNMLIPNFKSIKGIEPDDYPP